ncbi:MAG: acetoin utilization protein AcuC [Propionibacteriales bacterium]|nr:acetoin utilization protein AcuC [Propionibacteriales bacterium]
MSGAASVVFEAALTGYDFGLGHPLAPIRVDLTMRLAHDLGVFDLPAVELVAAPAASDDELQLIHSPAYVGAVRAAGHSGRMDLAHGLGTGDNPTFPGMHEASAHIAGASIEAARRVWSGESSHAVNISGGLHHAMADYASGFCIYNDPAIAIAWLLEQGAERVAYVDVDVHHGDGVQAAFYNDPRVLTISLHENPQTLFPGTGDATESGGPDAPGCSVNVALPVGTADGGWLRAFHAVVPPLLREFQPEVLVSQHGCDSHRLDPLAHLLLSVDGQRAAQLALHDLAHEICGGRWVTTGGGGYAVVAVVPRAWSHLLFVVGGRPLPPETAVPSGWRDYVVASTGRRDAPTVMTDGCEPVYEDWSNSYDPDSELDRFVERTRGAVFPFHGLDLSQS